MLVKAYNKKDIIPISLKQVEKPNQRPRVTSY